MGIPSYFRRILQAYPACLQKQAPTTAGLLAFDFNCLIYRCLRQPDMPPYPGVQDRDAHEQWESVLCAQVCKTVKEVWTVAGRPSSVFLAIDGVVPMAKIRQQRVRRFKSAWIRKTFGTKDGQESWDSNAITPGTEFMEKLSNELQKLVKQHGKGWVLSDSREPGEGEHKIMELLREDKKLAQKPVIVYGLDADLILLSLLAETPIWLLREKQEFGGKVRSVDGEQEYQFMNIELFRERLGIETKEECINYCTLMSLMGNDFLPHSLTHKLNDDGHESVLQTFASMKKGGKWIVKDGLIQKTVFLAIVRNWAKEEDHRMAHMIAEKRRRCQQGVGKGMEEYENLPAEWNVEKQLDEKGSDWRRAYWSFVHPHVTVDDKKRYCSEYLKGLQWILDYYTGIPVDKQWMFLAWMPPLWSDFTETEGGVSDRVVCEASKSPIQPEEQLAMVLPLESWGLIRHKEYRHLPRVVPQFWPAKFGFLSLGRRYLWECEALIPVLTAGRIRQILNTSK